MSKMLSIDIMDVVKNADPGELAAAMQKAYGMAGIRTIKDMWENLPADLHGIPSAHEIPSGPAMHSSSSGAERAVNAYSNPAAQQGLVEVYRDFEKLIADFGSGMAKSKEFQDTIKSDVEKLGEAVGNILAAQKRNMEEAEILKAKKESKKAKKMDKMKGKAMACAKKAKEEIAELTAAIQKAAEFAAIDVGFVSEARKRLIDAGAYAETYVDHDAKGDVVPAYEAAIKAKKELKKAWIALVKAERSALASHGLHGHGNQKDEAEPDGGHADVAKSLLIGSARDQALGGLQILSEAKANGGTLPEGMKSESAEVEVQKAEEKDEKKEKKEEKDEKDEKKPAPFEKKAETPAAEEPKEDNFRKAVVDRLAQIESRMSSTPNKPNISPVILKSGIQSDSLMKTLTDKLIQAQKEHTMSEEGIGKARNLLERLRAVAKGRLDGSIVQKQLEQSDDEVRNFFYVIDKELMSAAN